FPAAPMESCMLLCVLPVPAFLFLAQLLGIRHQLPACQLGVAMENELCLDEPFPVLLEPGSGVLQGSPFRGQLVFTALHLRLLALPVLVPALSKSATQCGQPLAIFLELFLAEHQLLTAVLQLLEHLPPALFVGGPLLPQSRAGRADLLLQLQELPTTLLQVVGPLSPLPLQGQPPLLERSFFFTQARLCSR